MENDSTSKNDVEKTLLTKLQQYRSKLLDLSGRNKMLNFKLTKSQGVDFVVEDISNEILKIVLVGDDDPWFEIVATKDDIREEENAEISKKDVEEDEWFSPMEKVYFETKYRQRELTRRLTKTLQRHREALDDRGVNILGLATAFLECPLQTVNGFSKTDSWNIPLLLVKLTMERRKDKKGRNHLVLQTQDEVMINPAAVRYLSDEMTPPIRIPELEIGDPPEGMTETEAIDWRKKIIDSWLIETANVLPEGKGWKLDTHRMAISSSFTFHKFPMYEDLNTTLWALPPATNLLTLSALIKRLLGVAIDEPADSGGIDDEKLEASSDLFTVLDADSSQLTAILEADAGRNLVIHGPPGTGKSQTITNLIAQLVAKDKKVLFVSEKRAALEVVAKNLRSAGLKNAYVDLHASQSEPKAFRDRIKQTWDIAHAAYSADNSFAQNLSALKKTQEILDQYANAVNTAVGKAEINFGHAVGRISQLDEAMVVKAQSFAVDKIEDWDREDYQERVDFSARLIPILQRVGKLSLSPFAPYWSKFSTAPVSSGRMRELLAKLIKDLDQIESDHPSNIGIYTHAELKAAQSPKLSQRFFTLSREIDLVVLEKIRVDDRLWKENSTKLRQLPKILAELKMNRKNSMLNFKEDVLEDQELGKLRDSISNLGRSWLRRFGKSYKTRSAQFESLYKADWAPTKNHFERIKELEMLLSLQKSIEEFDARYDQLASKLFPGIWRGLETSSKTLELALENKKKIDEIAKELSVTEKTTLNELKLFTQVNAAYGKKLAVFAESLKIFLSQIIDSDTLIDQITDDLLSNNFDDLREILVRLEAHTFQIDDLIVLKYKERDAARYGLSALFSAALEDTDLASELTTTLSCLWYDYYLNLAREKFPILNEHFGVELTGYRKAFSIYDKEFLTGNRRRIEEAHTKNVKGLVTRVRFDKSVEFINQLFHLSRFKAQRRPRALLMNHLPTIQSLFPIFMMSPLAVAQYLPRKQCFDVVIFDEASQVLPEDALGAIARGKQLIVVGDQKQLPPSSFFSAISEEDEENEEDDLVDSVESLIDLSLASGFNEAHLNWHYRSQHESLIRLSSKEFYNDSLIYTPSPEKLEGRGLSMIHTTGTYHRGGGLGGTNAGEAAEVAAAVWNFYQSQWIAEGSEKPSLGVVSFSKAQQEVIRDELKKISRKNENREFADFIDEERKDKEPEHFFIKNLENVQGDERDVIFISICYGKNDEGKIYQNFGPINQVGGERRLNVLMTRARQTCVVFSNFSADELSTSETTPRGVVILKEFIRYAETGDISIETLGEQRFESPFEESVADEIARLGYQYQSQVGVMGFRLDLAVRHPKLAGRYILAVECDGATYHSGRTARDRDRIREELLKGRGWNMYRIWSTDWRRDKKGEIARLKLAITEAIDRP